MICNAAFETKMADLLVDQEEEIEASTLDNGDGQDDLDMYRQPMIALQPFPDADCEELIIESTEDVICDSYIEVPHIAEEQEISSHDPSSPKPGKKRKSKSSKSKSNGKKGKLTNTEDDDGTNDMIDVPRKWERKKVQIKTLEGEFSVTMWASGVTISSNFSRSVIIFSFCYRYRVIRAIVND